MYCKNDDNNSNNKNNTKQSITAAEVEQSKDEMEGIQIITVNHVQ
jgi:hypothetical protein